MEFLKNRSNEIRRNEIPIRPEPPVSTYTKTKTKHLLATTVPITPVFLDGLANASGH